MAVRAKRRATIVDVARVAGLSKSTVARVLAGAPEISEQARETVLAAAQAVSYERNHLASGMRSGRSGLLGLVIPDITNPFWAEVARGALDRAAKADVSLLVFSSDWQVETEAAHLRALRRARVDGAILNPVTDDFSDLDRFGMPFVLIGSSSERLAEEAPSVGSDIAQAVRLGMDYLVSKGHPLPVLLLGTKTRLARARFLNAVNAHSIARDIDPGRLQIVEGEYTVEGGRAAMQGLLAGWTGGHLCVFAANDLMALGAMMAVREAGLSCPEDVSVMGFDGIPGGAYAWPGLTTIAKPGRDIGVQAVDSLFAEIAGEARRGRRRLACDLVERGSVADLLTEGRRGPAGEGA